MIPRRCGVLEGRVCWRSSNGPHLASSACAPRERLGPPPSIGVQRGDDYRIRLTGPFGGGGLEIEGDPNAVELRTADNKVYTATDAEELLYQHVGWRMPLTGLRYWILGRVEPEAPVEKVFIDVGGRVARFTQLGWKVNYYDYRDVDELAMPRKAALENDRVTASVLISRWTLGEAPSETE